MKSKIVYSLFILLFFSCKTKIVTPPKIKKIALHTYTGKGKRDETTNWFYIKNVADRGYSGYYLQTTLTVSDFKYANFIYSKTRPSEFDGQAASDEKIQFLSPGDLPDYLLKDSASLESSYK